MNWHDLIDAAIVNRLGWTLLHSLWQGAAIAVLLALFMLALRAATPQSRYLAATTALALLLLAPVATFTLLPNPPFTPAQPIAPSLAQNIMPSPTPAIIPPPRSSEHFSISIDIPWTSR